MVFSNTELDSNSPLMMRQKLQEFIEVVAVDIIWRLRSGLNYSPAFSGPAAVRDF